MIDIYCPNGLTEIKEVYGTPDADSNYLLDEIYYRNYLRVFRLPFSMRLSWRPNQRITRFLAHIDVGASVVDSLREIRDYKGVGYLQKHELDRWGGCFNFRIKKGGVDLSTHSWGIAIDINPKLGQMGVKSTMPGFIVDAFKKRGWVWGGDWKYPDGMHFQACEGY